MLISRETFLEIIQYVIQSQFVQHVIRALTSHKTEPDMCIYGSSFIFEMDTKDMAASVSIPWTNVISLMPVNCVKS